MTGAFATGFLTVADFRQLQEEEAALNNCSATNQATN
jgi:hypothetical protein